MDVQNVLIAAGVSILSAVLTESINWYFVYRKEEYKKLVSDVNES